MRRGNPEKYTSRRRSTRCSTRPSSPRARTAPPDRKSTRLNSSHTVISYAVFCLKKKKKIRIKKNIYCPQDELLCNDKTSYPEIDSEKLCTQMHILLWL